MSLDGNLQLGFQQVATAMKLRILSSEKGANNGVATLGNDGKVPSTQLPSYVDDVVEYANLAGFPASGETGKIYVALDTNVVYRWSGTVYVKITSGEVSSVAGRTGSVVLTKSDVGLANVDNTSDADKPVSTLQAASIATKAPIASPTFTGTVSGVTATMVGLGNVTNESKSTMFASPTFTGTVSGVTKTMVGLANVDNTTDALKPVSTATQTALNLKADLASPTFTGTVGGITKTMVGLGSADNTSDANKPVSTATQTALNLKANLASPTFTGTVAGISKAMVGLGNVDNTSDAAKPISTATQTAITTLSDNVGATNTDYVAVFNAALV
jgi:hypothetical protein